MKNLKIYSIIAIFGMGIMLSSCGGADEDQKSALEALTGIEGLSEVLDSMNTEFDSALEEMDDAGMLDGTSITAAEVKEFDEALQNKDYDEAIDIYEKYFLEYMEKGKAMEEGDLSNMQEIMGMATVMTKMSIDILPAIPKMSPEQQERFDNIDKQIKELDEE